MRQVYKTCLHLNSGIYSFTEKETEDLNAKEISKLKETSLYGKNSYLVKTGEAKNEKIERTTQEIANLRS